METVLLHQHDSLVCSHVYVLSQLLFQRSVTLCLVSSVIDICFLYMLIATSDAVMPLFHPDVPTLLTCKRDCNFAIGQGGQ